MGVIHLVFTVEKGDSSTRSGLTPPILQALTARDAKSVSAVTDTVHPGEFGFRSAAAVLADLEGRSGRMVEGWLASDHGVPVGLAMLVSASGNRGVRHSIGWLLVAARHRRTGVGSALVAAAVDRARNGGARHLWVETRDDWPGVVAFWQAVGFTIARRA